MKRFDPDEPLTAAAERVLKEHVRALVKNEAGTKKDIDIEYLHRMRVAVNRLRVAVMLFWHCYPKKKITFLKDELRWLAKCLGMVRDCDVTIERLTGIRNEAPDEVKQGHDIFISEILAERDARFAKLLKTLDSKRYLKLRTILMKTTGLYKKPAAKTASPPYEQGNPETATTETAPAEHQAKEEVGPPENAVAVKINEGAEIPQTETGGEAKDG